MDSFVCSPFSAYQSLRSSPALGRGWEAAAKQPSWKQSKSGGITPFLGGPFTPLPSECLDGYRRAQLQALLSQVGPALAPRARRASTREAAVQVSLRAEAAVQCSLGPRTLPTARRAPARLALYSPGPDRRLCAPPETAPAEESPTAAGGQERQEESPAPRQRTAFQVRRDGPGRALDPHRLRSSTVLPALPRPGLALPHPEQESPACENPHVRIRARHNGLGWEGS